MVKVFCDRCGREIPNSRHCLQIEVQEMVHVENNEFEINPECLSTSKVLCAECDNQLKEFMKCQIVHF